MKGGEKERRAPQSTRDRSTSNGHKDSSDDEIYEADTDIDEVSFDQHAVVLKIRLCHVFRYIGTSLRTDSG